ncbi:hypothetical protein FACS189413_08490 [Bacteroidia bacterium]|nr:hypothetical protein FACS189413_08490 [Bacteroidia bacterium]
MNAEVMNFQILIKQIQSVQSALQSTAAHTINVALTVRNWLIGYYIVEFEQHGEDRATYGQKLLKNLEKTLKTKGMTERRFREFRRLYQVYPQIADEIANVLPPDTIRQMLSAEFDGEIVENQENANDIPAKILLTKLPYSQLNKIAQIDNPVKRAFYVVECIKGCWSYPELERQINTLYYERSGLSKNKKALSAFINQQSVQLQPKDVINTPVTLEFLGLSERALVTEMMPDDNLPVGILLCADKGNTQVKYATAGLDDNIFVQKYLIELPDENTLSEYVTKEFLLIESEK